MKNKANAGTNTGGCSLALPASFSNNLSNVASEVDSLKIAARIGDLPQDVNFAICGEVLRVFLEKNKIDFTALRDTETLENTEFWKPKHPSGVAGLKGQISCSPFSLGLSHERILQTNASPLKIIHIPRDYRHVVYERDGRNLLIDRMLVTWRH